MEYTYGNSGMTKMGDVWAYGPDWASAAKEANAFAARNGLTLSNSNPAKQTKAIQPEGQLAGTYEVYVFAVKR